MQDNVDKKKASGPVFTKKPENENQAQDQIDKVP